jgi:phosphopantetheine--protein transferase-like protein
MQRLETINQLLSIVSWAPPVVEGIVVAVAEDNGVLSNEQLAQCLSPQELAKCDTLIVPEERRHFLFRRVFQAVCVGKALNLPSGSADIQHRRNERPICVNVPKARLSFSSSGRLCLAAVSQTHDFGTDIERLRPVPNVVALARRFFTVPEADVIAAVPKADQSTVFFKHWTLKEAGLKAIGKGIVDGLNSFVLKPDGKVQHIDIIDKKDTASTFGLAHIAFPPGHIVAIVHNQHQNDNSG